MSNNWEKYTELDEGEIAIFGQGSHTPLIGQTKTWKEKEASPMTSQPSNSLTVICLFHVEVKGSGGWHLIEMPRFCQLVFSLVI